MVDIQLLNGKVVESAGTDNALATATVGAVSGCRNFITGIKAGYSLAVASAIKVIQVKLNGVVVLNIEWDPSKLTPGWFPFPSPIHGDYNQAVSAELAASGTPGTLGRVAIFGFTI